MTEILLFGVCVCVCVYVCWGICLCFHFFYLNSCHLVIRYCARSFICEGQDASKFFRPSGVPPSTLLCSCLVFLLLLSSCFYFSFNFYFFFWNKVWMCSPSWPWIDYLSQAVSDSLQSIYLSLLFLVLQSCTAISCFCTWRQQFTMLIWLAVNCYCGTVWSLT